jgi:hypothetical protein
MLTRLVRADGVRGRAHAETAALLTNLRIQVLRLPACARMLTYAALLTNLRIQVLLLYTRPHTATCVFTH